MLEEAAGYHIQQKQARTLHIISDLLDDFPSSSDTQTYSDTSNSSASPSSSSLTYSVSSPSSASDRFNSSSLTAHARHRSSSFEDFRSLKDRLLKRWDDHIQALAVYLLTARVLEACPPVMKSGQIELYLIHFQSDHPDLFQKKLCIFSIVFDHLVELIENHNVFHNNSHVP